MTPVISPVIIYLIGFIGKASILITSLLGLTGLAAFGFLVFGLVEGYPNLIERAKKCFIAFVVLLCLCTFIPSQQTLIAMIVVKNVTYERVGVAVNKTEEYIDYLVDYIFKVSKKEELKTIK